MPVVYRLYYSLTPHEPPCYVLSRGGILQVSQWEKLLSRICSMPRDVRFSEVKKVLEG